MLFNASAFFLLLRFIFANGSTSATTTTSGAACNSDTESFLPKSPGGVDSLETCSDLCKASVNCKSITLYASKWCSHFSTTCKNLVSEDGATTVIFKSGVQTGTGTFVGYGKRCTQGVLASSSVVSSLSKCLNSCEQSPACKSVTYFQSRWCSHFSTACENSVDSPNAASFTQLAARTTTTVASKGPGSGSGKTPSVMTGKACDTQKNTMLSKASGRVEGLAECTELCEASANCKSITFYGTSQWCTHFSTPCTDVIAMNGAFAGRVASGRSANFVSAGNGKQCSTADGEQALAGKEDSFSNCLDSCKQASDCKSVTYYFQSRWCSHFSTECEKTEDSWRAASFTKLAPTTTKTAATKRPTERPGSGSGKRPGSGSGKRPGSGSGKRPGSGSGKRPGSGSGKRPGSGSGAKKLLLNARCKCESINKNTYDCEGKCECSTKLQTYDKAFNTYCCEIPTKSGNTTCPDKGKRPGSGSGKRPGSGSGKRPGSGSGKRPGSGSGKRPGSGSGKRPGSGSGKRPGSGSGKRPGTTKPATKAPDAPKKIIDWKFGMTDAEKKQTVKTNTDVVFKWTGSHNVYKFSDKTAFDACDISKATQMALQNPYTFKASAAGTVYFACGVGKGSHCRAGIKLALTVTASGSGNRPGSGSGKRPGSGSGKRPGSGSGKRPGSGSGSGKRFRSSTMTPTTTTTAASVVMVGKACDTQKNTMLPKASGRADGLAECTELCEASANCKSITFYGTSQWCSHFSTPCTDVIIQNGATAGRVASGRSANFVSAGNGKRCSIADGEKNLAGKEDSFSNCLDSCKQASDCKSATYYFQSRWCSHFSTECEKTEDSWRAASFVKF